MFRFTSILVIILGVLVGCSNESTTAPTALVFQATVEEAQPTAPLYTSTPSPTATLTPSPTYTLTNTATLTATPTLTATSTPTLTPSQTPSPIPTQPLQTLTPASADGAPIALSSAVAEFAPTAGWSCEDFPCEDDIEGWLERINVPEGYTLEHIGRFPGQVLQIAYDADDKLYATVLENGTQDGAVYVMDIDGNPERYSETIHSPIGIAVQPGTNVVYVSGRIEPLSGGAVWRINPDGTQETVIDTLPCCYDIIGNQPNGLTFGPDGYLYLGVGALTDRLEPPNPERMKYAELQDFEASIVRIHPHTGEITTYAEGLRNPYDISFDSQGNFYASDEGLITGQGDRLVTGQQGQNFGWPYWRTLGCEECPIRDYSEDIQPDLLSLPDYTRPRGLTVYQSDHFPAELFDSVFVALWNATKDGQRIARIEPENIPTNEQMLMLYTPEPFVTGLVRPIDVIVDAEGALVVADFIYGHVWRVSYDGVRVTATPSGSLFATATPAP